MSKQEKRIAKLEQEIRDLKAYMGVLLPVIDSEYKKDGWDFAEAATADNSAAAARCRQISMIRAHKRGRALPR